MRKAEAYKELELPETATKEEVKKAFRKLAAQNHPDQNKDPKAEEKFKAINSAYQAIENNQFDDNQFQSSFGGGFGGFGGGIDFIDLGDLFGFGGRSNKQKAFIVKDINLEETITFKEAVLGCKKEVSYKCDVMCDKCNGQGAAVIHNGCATCGGTGRISNKQGGMFVQQTCRTCRGRVKKEECSKCVGSGKLNSERTMSVSIKPGIHDGNILRLTGMGNFIDYMIGNSNVLITVRVNPLEGLKLEGNDVITNVSISLLEALKGCSKEVNSIDGQKEIIVPALSKNKDEVILSNLGVGRNGNERVIVNIDYPKEIDKLINILEEEK